MKRKIILSLLLILLGKFSFSQQNYFNRNYYFSYNDIGFDILPEDSNYYFISGLSDSSYYISLLFGKMDGSGNVLRSQTTSDSVNSLYPGINGGLLTYDSTSFYLAGTIYISGTGNRNNTDVLLYKFNHSGDLLWKKQYVDSGFQAGWQVKHTRDGGLIFLINEAIPGAIDDIGLMKLDSSGVIQWHKHYGGPYYDIGVSMDTCIDGGFVISGGTSSFGPNTGTQCANMYCLKTDSLGNVQWQNGFGGIYYDAGWSVVQCKDSSIALAGFIALSDISATSTCDEGRNQLTILKLNQQGNVLWQKGYDGAKYGNCLYKLRELPDGNLIAVGQRGRDSLGFYQGVILKVASNGDSLWLHTYENLHGFQSDNVLRDIRQTEDGGFICCGFARGSSPDTGFEHSWVLKIDSVGCEQANCLLGTSVEMIEKENGILFYPNPSTGVFHLLNSTGYPINRISIYNELGVLVFETKEKDLIIDLEASPPGIYFYRVEAENKKLFKGKLMKEN